MGLFSISVLVPAKTLILIMLYMLTNQYYLIVLPSYKSRNLKIFTVDYR